FAGIWEAYKAHIGKNFQFQGDVGLFSRNARLGISGSLVGGRLEMPIATPSHSAFEYDSLFPVPGDLKKDFIGIRVPAHGAQGHVQLGVGRIGRGSWVFTAVLPVVGLEMFFERRVVKGPKSFVPRDNDMPAPPPIPSSGAALGHIFLTVQMGGTFAPVP